MKKLLGIIVLGLLFLSNVNAEERKSELDNLFKQLKNSEAQRAIDIENRIWQIWSIHPSNDRRGNRLTELLAQGSFLMSEKELNRAYEIFSQIILACYNMDKTTNQIDSFIKDINQFDSFRIDIRSRALALYLKKA